MEKNSTFYTCLNGNNYNKMLIDLLPEESKVSVLGKKENYPVIKDKNRYKITDDLKGLSDDEQILLLVDYFLENHKINVLSDKRGISYHDGYYSVAIEESPNNIILDDNVTLGVKFSESRMSLSRRINNKIINAYYRNLYEFAFDKSTNIDKIFSSDNPSFSKERNRIYLKSNTTINIFNQKEYNLSKQSYKFIEDYLLTRFDYKHNAYITWKALDGYCFSQMCIVCGDDYIIVDNVVAEDVRDILEKYNNEVDDRRFAQIRIRGI